MRGGAVSGQAPQMIWGPACTQAKLCMVMGCSTGHVRSLLLIGGGGSSGGGQLSPAPALLLLVQAKEEEAGKELQGYELLQPARLGPSCPICHWQRQDSGGDGLLALFR